MTEVQYNEKLSQIEKDIETLQREMTVLRDDILYFGETGEYSKINEMTELFLNKSDKVFDLMDERRVLNREIKQNGFDEPELDESDESSDEIDCRNYFCEGDRLKGGYMGKLAHATVECVKKDFFVLLFDQSDFEYEMYEKPELYEVFTAENLDFFEKI